MEKQTYYGLFDIPMDGFRIDMVSDDYNDLLEHSAEFIYEMSLGDSEPADKNLPPEEMLENYDYEVREISKEFFDVLDNSADRGVLPVFEINEKIEERDVV